MNAALCRGEQPGPGRPQGSKNRTTQQIKDALQLVIDSNLTQLEADLAALRPKDRVRAFIDLLAFILPRMTSQDARLSLSTLSDKELDGLLEKIIANPTPPTC